MAWDLVIAGLSSNIEETGQEVFYLQPKSPLTYNNQFQLIDPFDWHKANTFAFTMRFEDLFFFSLELLLLLSLL
jgi:hypothetical protein